MAGLDALPWRGPGPGRPEDLPLPPGKLPLRSAGTTRKQWRYVGAYCDDLMLCAARVQVGPFGQSFWAVWDRAEKKLYESTKTLMPGARGEVWSETPEGEPVFFSHEQGTVVRIEGKHPGLGEVKAKLRVGDGEWAECVCPNDAGAYVWTRKRADVEIECDLRMGANRLRVAARGMEDESAGYHPRHTVWSWSTGVGRSTDGRRIGWNLVEGVNDPAKNSERAIWIDGEPFEPPPASFDGLDAIGFESGERLAFAAEAERAREDSKVFFKSSYRQPFGTFSGTLPGGIELESGIGVMEHHDALW
ncbi:hypothetical protein BH10ACT11_BH10ACT11_09820 [soil metagenome]